MTVISLRQADRDTTNPLGFAYTGTTNVSLYGQPTGMLITGRTNRYDASFAAAKALGCEILAYLDAMERPDIAIGGLDDEFYLGNPSTVPLWPYLTQGNGGTTAGQNRINFAGNHMTDITVGSSWSNSVVSYISGLMTDSRINGVFLDVIGSRLYSTGATGANWDTDWSSTEQDAWTNGCIDLVNRLDAARRSINPKFIIVNNNVWNGRVDQLGTAAHAYINGICLEHHAALGANGALTSNAIYANTVFSDLGKRRVLAIASTRQDAQDWRKVPGVTHISDACREVVPTGTLYGSPTPPPVPFHNLGQ